MQSKLNARRRQSLKRLRMFSRSLKKVKKFHEKQKDLDTAARKAEETWQRKRAWAKLRGDQPATTTASASEVEGPSAAKTTDTATTKQAEAVKDTATAERRVGELDRRRQSRRQSIGGEFDRRRQSCRQSIRGASNRSRHPRKGRGAGSTQNRKIGTRETGPSICAHWS